jgi:hypothetical protein
MLEDKPMVRTLFIIAGAGLVISIASFAALDRIGGFEWKMHHHGHHGPQATRDLPWAGSESLHIDHSAAVVTYIQGPTPKFTVSGPKSRVDGLAINGDTLTGSDIHWHLTDDDDDDAIHITVTSPNTHVFFLSGAEALTLANFEQDSLEMNISGAAHVKAVGHAKRATITMSGAGRLDLAAMPVDDLKLDISGAGSATADPKVSADISISGAGHVGLLTRPAKLHTNISGIGAVTTPDGTEGGRRDRNDREDD